MNRQYREETVSSISRYHALEQKCVLQRATALEMREFLELRQRLMSLDLMGILLDEIAILKRQLQEEPK